METQTLNALAVEERAADILLSVRQTGVAIDDLPLELQPKTLAESYAIQNAVARRLGPICGWKVGPAKDGQEAQGGPIPSQGYRSTGFLCPPVVTTRFEVEFALKMGKDLPPRTTPYTAADIKPAIASGHIAFELLSDRFKDKTKVAALTRLADGISNVGISVGDEIPNWQSLDLTKLEIVLKTNGEITKKVETGSAAEPVMESMAWLANHVAKYFGGLKAGDVILTGARIGPLPIAKGDVLEAIANGVAKVQVKRGDV